MLSENNTGFVKLYVSSDRSDSRSVEYEIITVSCASVLGISVNLDIEGDIVPKGDCLVKLVDKLVIYFAAGAIFMPLIGFDKEEIVTIARKIGTMETSILPYEDCCTVFTPKHPKTKPTLGQLLNAEKNLDREALIEQALATVEKITVKYDDAPYL